jgi:hypothetical protein
MTRVVITTACTLPKIPAVGSTGGSPAQMLVKGRTAELTAAQLAAVSSAGGATRAVSTATVHDQMGEAAGVSNGN